MESLEKFKKYQIRIAKQLQYSEEVIRKIEGAKTVYEVDRIMIQARRNKKYFIN